MIRVCGNRAHRSTYRPATEVSLHWMPIQAHSNMAHRKESLIESKSAPGEAISTLSFLYGIADDTCNSVDFPDTHPGPCHVPSKERHTLPSCVAWEINMHVAEANDLLHRDWD